MARTHANGDKISNFRYLGRKSHNNCGAISEMAANRLFLVSSLFWSLLSQNLVWRVLSKKGRSVKYLRCLCFNFLSTLQIGGATLNCKIIYLPPDKFWFITMLNLSLNTPLHWISYKQPKIFSINSWWDGYFDKSTEKARINAKISYILATPWLIWKKTL